MALDIQKYLVDPKYDVIKDAGGQIIQIKAKPQEFVSKVYKDEDRQEKSTYSPHIIKFIEGKPVREEFYEVNPSRITNSIREQVAYTPKVVEYDPQGNVSRMQEYKWDWGDRGRTTREGTVVLKYDEKYEGGVKKWVYDFKADTYVDVIDLEAGTRQRTQVAESEGMRRFKEVQAEKAQAQSQATGIGWYDPQQKAFVTGEGKKYPSTTPSWTPQGYTRLDAPLSLKKGESYYDPKIGGVVTGEGKFYASTTAFAPSGTTLIGTSTLLKRAETKAPTLQGYSITGRETPLDIAYISYKTPAPLGYKTPAGETIKHLPEGYVGTEEGFMTITGDVVRQQEAVKKYEGQKKEIYDWTQKKYLSGETIIETPPLSVAQLATGESPVQVRQTIKLGEVVPEEVKPRIPTVARAELDIITGLPLAKVEEGVTKAKVEPSFMEKIGMGAAIGIGTVAGAVTGKVEKAKEYVAERPVLGSALAGAFWLPITAYRGYEYLGGKASEALKANVLTEPTIGGQIDKWFTGALGPAPVSAGPTISTYDLVDGQMVWTTRQPSSLANLGTEPIEGSRGVRSTSKVYTEVFEPFSQFAGGFQQQLYTQFRERPLDVPTVYALSYGLGSGLTSLGALGKGEAAYLGAKQALGWVPTAYKVGGGVIKGGLLVGGAGLIGLEMATKPTWAERGAVAGKTAYYAVPGMYGYTAGSQSKWLPRFEYVEQAIPIDVSQEMIEGVPTPKIVTQTGYKGVGWRVGTRGAPIRGAGLLPETVEQQMGTMLTAEGLPAGPMYHVVPSSTSPVALPTRYYPIAGVGPVDITRSVSPLALTGPTQTAILYSSAQRYYPEFYGTEATTAKESMATALSKLGTYRGPTPKEFLADIGEQPVPKPAVREVAKLASERGGEIFGSGARQTQYETQFYRAGGGETVAHDIDIALIRGEHPATTPTEFAETAVQRIAKVGGGARVSSMNAQVVEFRGIEKPGEFGKFLDIHGKGELYPGMTGDEVMGVGLWQTPQQTPIVAGERGTVGLIPRGESLARGVSSVFSITPEGFQPEPNRVKDIGTLMSQLTELGTRTRGAKSASAMQALADLRTLFPDVQPAIGKVVSIAPSTALAKAASLTSAGAVSGVSTASFAVSTAPSYPSVSGATAMVGLEPVSVAPSRVRTSKVSVSPSLSLRSPLMSSVSASSSVSPSAYQSIYPSVSPSVSPSISHSVSPSVSVSTYPSVSPSVSPSASPSVSPSVYPSVYPSISPSVSPSVYPSVYPYTYPYTSYSPPPLPVATIPGLDSGYKGGYRTKRKRKYAYTPDLRAIMTGEYSYEQPKKGIFTGQERRFIILPKGAKIPKAPITF
jgi:hypothetical protein